jgi:hypothetical protein
MKYDGRRMVGLKCKKKSKKGTEPKPFKSGLKINTIKALAINPNTKNFAFEFEEDESVVDCRSIILLDDNNVEVGYNDITRQDQIHKQRKKQNEAP